MARQHDDFKHTVQKNPTPGDVRFKDVDGDGFITEIYGIVVLKDVSVPKKKEKNKA